MESFPDTAVIIVTGVDDRKTAIDALQLGAYGYLIKPFDRNEVAINVANALERRRLNLMSREYEEHLERELRERTLDIRRREEEIILRLVSASEYRDEKTGAHNRRIALYSAALARVLGWDAGKVEDLRIAALMHDIGKIGIQDEILFKPSRVSAAEYEILKGHTRIGAGILEKSEIPLLKTARDIALSHHEKWDGSGYPAGLAEEAIPVPARIVAVVDVYDAITNGRPYKSAVPEDDAIAIMRSESGKAFDPEILECFLQNLHVFRTIQQQVLSVGSA